MLQFSVQGLLYALPCLNEQGTADLGARVEEPRRLATEIGLREKHTDSQVVSQMQTHTHTNFSGKRQNNQTQGRGINPLYSKCSKINTVQKVHITKHVSISVQGQRGGKKRDCPHIFCFMIILHPTYPNNYLLLKETTTYLVERRNPLK